MLTKDTLSGACLARIHDVRREHARFRTEKGQVRPNGGGTPSTRPTFFPWPQGDTSAAVNEGSRYRRRQCQCTRLLQAASGSAP